MDDSKRWYHSRTVWLNAFTVFSLVLTALLGTELVQQNPQLVLWLLAGVAVANVLLRWLTTMPIAAWLAFACLVLAGPLAMAEEVAVLIDDTKPGSFLVIVGADGSIAVNPIRVLRPGQSPSPPTDPTDPPSAPTAFSETVSALTKQSIASGGSPTTAAGLSAVYSLVSSGVKDGSIPEASALAAVKAATDTVLANVADSAKWAKWRTDLGLALETLKQQGVLKIPSALDEVAAGIDTAIGKKIDPTKLAGLTEAQQNREAAIFDGLDLAKIIELIRLIMDLLKLFKGQ